MQTVAFHQQPTTPLRVMDFIVLAVLAVALAFVASSDKAPVRTTEMTTAR